MSKIYPLGKQRREWESESELAVILKGPLHPNSTPSVLTVWKRSSISFHGTDGFMVFDHRGKLVFRVDNYTRHSWSVGGGGLLLMDAHGRALLTLKPQVMMGMQQQWNGYEGEGEGEGEGDERSRPSKFTMRRPKRSRRDTTCEAEVFLGDKAWELSGRRPDLKSEGSFRTRNCKISATHNGELVAKISRKRISSTLVLGDDVFTLAVQPGFDPAVVMAFVMILARICHRPFTPFLCS